MPKLPYNYDALEPFISASSVEVIYEKHQSGYLDKLNSAVAVLGLKDLHLKELLKNVSRYPVEIKNYGGGFYNHSLFWQLLTPHFEEIKDVHLIDSIIKYFGTFEKLKEEFTEVALKHFGAGWAWLVKRKRGELLVYSTPNQNNPLMDITPYRGEPILCLNLWEHAYHDQYQNDRLAYIQSFWQLVNWQKVAELYNKD